MEKVESVKKQNRIVEILSTKKAKYIIGTILLSGIGVALPQIFHLIGGQSAGTMFLPMHIAVLIASLVFGGVSATIVASCSAVFGYLITGMPPITRLPYMLIELVIYAVLLSVLNRKFNSYISLTATIILGRILYAGVILFSSNILGLNTYGISVLESFKMGIPGIILQLLLVPIIAKYTKKGLGI